MKKPVKILFDANSLAVKRTGVGQYTSRLVESMAREHPDVQFTGYYFNFLCRKPRLTSPNGPNLSYRQILWMPAPVVNSLRRIRILLPVELLTFTRPDFVFYPNYLGLASIFRIPSACTIHDLTFIDLPEYVAKKNLNDLVKYAPKQMRRSRFTTTVSEFSKRRIVEEFDIAASSILVTPIPPETPGAVDSKHALSVLRKFKISGKYILTLGTVEPRKNLPNLLEAYLQLPDKLQAEYALVIVGKVGWNCDREVALLARLKAEGRNVKHLGYIDNADREVLYRNATLFTSASWYEGFGMPALEAMIVGTPCALSDIDVFHEVAGTAAVYFDQEQPNSISNAWRELLADERLRERLAAEGLAQAKMHTWSEVANQLYKKMASTMKETKL